MTNELLNLPHPALDVLTGDARQRLVRYLLRWNHTETLLGYLERWLATQPHAVTLRENRARALLDLNRADEALAILDAINAERGASQTRRQFRIRILLACGNYAAADEELATAYPDESNMMLWLLRGDIAKAQKLADDAAACYQQAASIEPDSAAPARRMAGLALQQGDGEAARGQIDALMLRPDFAPTIEDLQLLHDAAWLLEDEASATAIAAQLADREREERGPLEAELGLRMARRSPTLDDAAPPPEAPAAPERPLPAKAYNVLREHFGLNDFRPNQTRVIANALAGRSTLAVMPTGAGKSLTYQLPAMLLPHATVVVSPLIALMKDQLDGLPESVREQATTINSTLSGAEVSARLRGIAEGRYKLVYIAPERLRVRPFLHALKRCGVSLFVVDEVHCVSLWGLSFRPDYLFIKRALEELGHPPLLALTATATPETQAEIRAHLGEAELVSASVFRPNLFFQVVRAGNRGDKEQALVETCRRIAGPIIIYARARQTCEELAETLRRSGVQADYYHAHVANRAATQERFMRGETRVLVATVAFGMGIDKADIRAIIHFNLPASVEAYYQEAGRAGRDGQPARCILLYAASDKSRMTQWLNEEALSLEQLRELYRVVKRAMGGPYDVVNLDGLQRSMQLEDDTLVRVGLSMLERVGLLRRHFDLPRNVTLTLKVEPGRNAEAQKPRDAEGFDEHMFGRLIEALGLMQGVPQEVNLLGLAEGLGLTPTALEGHLLLWHDGGQLRYQASQREALLELLPAPADIADRIVKLLNEYSRRQDERVEAIAAYARGARCRHVNLANHFGQRLAICRTTCDICTPQPLPLPKTTAARPAFAPLPPRNDDDPRSDTQRVLDGLTNLPFSMGRSGFAKVLKGSSSSPVEEDRCPEYGALRHLTSSAIEDLIEELIENGHIHRDESHEHRRLSITAAGSRARREG
ncbi:MAG: RecQ family ATP-dependent DNA helicase [Chloroflexaceae bacterium]|jgi:ATP-dependent DNA helicase RecQ|nr:RecQ family ATP-dependent DNA helicase [Chloroflexaceae bacterium]